MPLSKAQILQCNCWWQTAQDKACSGRLPAVNELYSMREYKSAAGAALKKKGLKQSENLSLDVSMKKNPLFYLHRCQGGGLRQRPSWSSAPSSHRSDSGLASSGPGSRRGHRGRRRGSHLQREKDRNDLGGEEKREQEDRQG